MHITVELHANLVDTALSCSRTQKNLFDLAGKIQFRDDFNHKKIRELRAFSEKSIEIAVTEAEINGLDETDYLLGNPANKARLLKALEVISHPRNLVHIELSDLEQRSVE